MISAKTVIQDSSEMYELMSSKRHQLTDLRANDCVQQLCRLRTRQTKGLKRSMMVSVSGNRSMHSSALGYCYMDSINKNSMLRVIIICAISLSMACNLAAAANQLTSPSHTKDKQQQETSTHRLNISTTSSTIKQLNHSNRSSPLATSVSMMNRSDPMLSPQIPRTTTPIAITHNSTTIAGTPTPGSSITDRTGSLRSSNEADLSPPQSSMTNTATKFLAPPSTTEALQTSSSTTVASSSVQNDQFTSESRDRHRSVSPFSANVIENATTSSNVGPQLSNDWSPRAGPFAGRAPAASRGPKSQGVSGQSVSTNKQPTITNLKARESVEQQPTNRLVNFADPPASASDIHQSDAPFKQQRQSKLSNQSKRKSPSLDSKQASDNGASASNNRWTHFGARLRPLASATGVGLDYHQAATSSKVASSANIVIMNNQLEQTVGGDGRNLVVGQPAPVRGSNNGRQQTEAVVFVAPLTTNSLTMEGNSIGGAGGGHGTNRNEQLVGRNNGDHDDDDDDDLDGEALLYKMMQQQHFLMNPSWQQQSNLLVANAAVASEKANNANAAKLGQTTASNQASEARRAAINENRDLAGSKKVIKLLKSYSHIHQVDDSDDQIRGTYTRISSQRPRLISAQDREFRSGDQTQHRGANHGARQHHRPSQQESFARAQGAGQQTGRLTGYQGNQFAVEDNYSPSNQLDSSDSDSDDSGASKASDSGSSGNNNGQPEEEEFECPNNGIFADVASGCQAYHVCQSGAQVQEKFQCPLGTLFNNIILTCDFAHNVQCNVAATGPSQSRSPAPNTNEDKLNHNNKWLAGPRSDAGQESPRDESTNSRDEDDGQQVALLKAKSLTNSQKASRAQPTGRGHAQVARQQHHQSQPSGPRQLVIGTASQYNRHNQNKQLESHTLAVGSYPPQSSLTSDTGNQPTGHDNSETEADDNDTDPSPQPLIPATLPPRARQGQFGSGQVSPYQAAQSGVSGYQNYQSNQLTQYVSNQDQQYNQNQARSGQQPVHKSVVATTDSNNDQADQRPTFGSIYDSASPAVTYASRDQNEILSSPTPIPQQASSVAPQGVNRFQEQAGASVAGPTSGATGVPASQAQSFNLFINHMTPTQSAPPRQQQQQLIVEPDRRQQQSGLQPAPVVESKRIINNGAPVSVSPTGQATPASQLSHNPSSNKQRHESQRAKQQHQHLHHQTRQASNPTRSAPPTPLRSASQLSIARQQQQVVSVHEQNHNGDSSQLASVVNQNQQRHQTAPGAGGHGHGLVDLTNDDRKSTGVSSEALNDGLLLIVRHSPNSSPIQMIGASPTSKQRISSGARQSSSNQQAGSSPAASSSSDSIKHSSNQANGQAFAVDPTIVNPNSPVDAQLFPNVQRVIASSIQQRQQQQQIGSHKNLQLIQHKPNGQASSEIRVAGLLPPMEPPKPQHLQQHSKHQQHPQPSDLVATDQVALSASASNLQSSGPKPATATTISTNKAHKQRVVRTRRAKRVESNQTKPVTTPAQANSTTVLPVSQG